MSFVGSSRYGIVVLQKHGVILVENFGFPIDTLVFICWNTLVSLPYIRHLQQGCVLSYIDMFNVIFSAFPITALALLSIILKVVCLCSAHIFKRLFQRCGFRLWIHTSNQCLRPEPARFEKQKNNHAHCAIVCLLSNCLTSYWFGQENRGGWLDSVSWTSSLSRFHIKIGKNRPTDKTKSKG